MAKSWNETRISFHYQYLFGIRDGEKHLELVEGFNVLMDSLVVKL